MSTVSCSVATWRASASRCARSELSSSTSAASRRAAAAAAPRSCGGSSRASPAGSRAALLFDLDDGVRRRAACRRPCAAAGWWAARPAWACAVRARRREPGGRDRRRHELRLVDALLDPAHHAAQRLDVVRRDVLCARVLPHGPRLARLVALEIRVGLEVVVADARRLVVGLELIERGAVVAELIVVPFELALALGRRGPPDRLGGPTRLRREQNVVLRHLTHRARARVNTLNRAGGACASDSPATLSASPFRVPRA